MSATPVYGREVPLSSYYLDKLASPDGDPESLLIAKEEGEEEPPPRRIPERVLAVIREFLPPEEAYLLERHLMQGQYQSTIAGNIGSVKQSIQYRIHRAIERVQWALTLRTWNKTRDEIWRELGDVLSYEQTNFTHALWANRWNQTRTAQSLDSTQSEVRVRVIRLHRTMRDMVVDFAISNGPRYPGVEPYFLDLTAVMQHGAWCLGVGQVQGPRAIQFPKAVTTRPESVLRDKRPFRKFAASRRAVGR